MANTTEATYSFTTKVNGDLLTVRGNTKDEFALNLANLHDDQVLIEMISSLQQKFKPTSVAEIQAAFNGTVIPDPLASKPTPPAPVRPAGFSPMPSNAPTGVVPMCEHGPMRFVKGGMSKTTGKGYPAFYSCSMPKGQSQCKSVNA
jgi:hypothetical protein